MERLKKEWAKMLEKAWGNKQIWELIRDGEYSSAPPFKGMLYDESNLKIMYVGHALNGWEKFSPNTCGTLANTVDTIFSQSDEEMLNTFVYKDGVSYEKNGKKRVYRHINSNFLRMIKTVLEYQGLSNGPITEDNWYQDDKKWNQRFVWTNLYSIAPTEGGYPSDPFIKNLMEQLVDSLKIQIEIYEPDIIIMCPLSGYVDPWKRLPSFGKALGIVECCENDVIKGKGTYKNSKIIVVKRPDVHGTSYETVNKMAKVISDYIDNDVK